MPHPHATALNFQGRHQRGLTLVEMMVSLGLGLIVISALLLLLANASQANQNLQRSANQLENGRFVAELLRDEWQMAGFLGEAATTGAQWADPDPCATTPSGFSRSPLTLPAAVQGIAAGQALGCLSHRLSNTQALVVRRLAADTTAVAALSGASQYYVQYSRCNTDPAATPMVFDHVAAQFTLRDRACTAASPLRAVVVQIFFIAECNRCGSGGDNVPTLKRMDLVGSQWVETALVDGVEALRLEYGLDTDNNGAPDMFLTALTNDPALATSKWSNVMALRVHYVTRSVDKTAGAALSAAQTLVLGNTGSLSTAQDGYVRQAYSSTIRLVNPSAAREVQ